MTDTALYYTDVPRISPAWGLPKRFLGASLLTEDNRRSAWLTDAVWSWVTLSATGEVFLSDTRSYGRYVGRGLTVVGEDSDTHELLAAMIQDLVRDMGDGRHLPGIQSSDWMQWFTAAQLNTDCRKDLDAWEYWYTLPFLVVTDINTSDQWSLGTVANILSVRVRKGRPTMVAMSSDNYKAIQGVGDNPSVHSGLRGSLDYANELVLL